MSRRRIPVLLASLALASLAATGCASDDAPPAAPGAAWIGTSWQIALLHGIPVQDGIDSTLSFPSPGLVAGLANGGKEDADQERDDGDHHQQLDDGERPSRVPAHVRCALWPNPTRDDSPRATA